MANPADPAAAFRRKHVDLHGLREISAALGVDLEREPLPPQIDPEAEADVPFQGVRVSVL